MPNGGKSRKCSFAWEVCTKRMVTKVENFRSGTNDVCFTNVIGVEKILFDEIVHTCHQRRMIARGSEKVWYGYAPCLLREWQIPFSMI